MAPEPGLHSPLRAEEIGPGKGRAIRSTILKNSGTRFLACKGEKNMIPWGLVLLVVGILYGWLSPGRQDKSRLFKSGFLVGIVLSIVFAVIGLLVGASPLGVGTGVLGVILAAIVMSLLFILGVWLGDLIEGSGRQRVA
jgi:hypothetical protein